MSLAKNLSYLGKDIPNNFKTPFDLDFHYEKLYEYRLNKLDIEEFKFRYKVFYLADKLEGRGELNRIEKSFINRNYEKIMLLSNCINLDLIKIYDNL